MKLGKATEQNDGIERHERQIGQVPNGLYDFIAFAPYYY
jgi:hypothetical protein